MAELPHIGQNCSVESCNLLDFLPFKCMFCDEIFCLNHRNPDGHNCPNYQDCRLETIPNNSISLVHSCQFTDCSKGEIFPVTCPKCVKNFCLEHRHPPDHCCEGLNQELEFEQNQQREKKLEIENIIKDFRKSNEKAETAPTSKPQGRKSKEMALKVKLMKMKSKSVGPSGTPESEKVFFNIRFSENFGDREELLVFFNKMWSIGKSIDWLVKFKKFKKDLNAKEIRLCWLSKPLPNNFTWVDILDPRIDGLVSGENLSLENHKENQNEFKIDHTREESLEIKNTIIKDEKQNDLTEPSIKTDAAKPKDTAIKLKLMKMKLKAIDPKNTTENEKIFFNINLPKGHSKQELIVYFNKALTVGRSIDWITDIEKLSNKNNVPNATKIHLYWMGRELPFSSTWNDILKTRSQDGLISGESLYLEYGLSKDLV